MNKVFCPPDEQKFTTKVKQITILKKPEEAVFIFAHVLNHAVPVAIISPHSRQTDWAVNNVTVGSALFQCPLQLQQSDSDQKCPVTAGLPNYSDTLPSVQNLPSVKQKTRNSGNTASQMERHRNAFESDDQFPKFHILFSKVTNEPVIQIYK